MYTHAEGLLSVAGKDTGETIAAHAEGRHTRAYGNYSHVEGYECQAEGEGSHAEGGYSRANGNYSHAEGDACKANAINSHAQNLGTKASSDNQTAIGRYNIEDTNNIYAFIIGNGNYTSPNYNYSNAFTISWDGNIEMALDTSASSGTDYDLYAAMTALGWESEVIV